MPFPFSIDNEIVISKDESPNLSQEKLIQLIEKFLIDADQIIIKKDDNQISFRSKTIFKFVRLGPKFVKYRIVIKGIIKIEVIGNKIKIINKSVVFPVFILTLTLLFLLILETRILDGLKTNEVYIFLLIGFFWIIGTIYLYMFMGMRRLKNDLRLMISKLMA